MRNKSSLQISLLVIIIFLLIGTLLKTTEYKEIKRQTYECEISYENWLTFEKSRLDHLARTNKINWDRQRFLVPELWASDLISNLTREDYEERKKGGSGEIVAYRSVPLMGNVIKIANFKIYTSIPDDPLPSLSKLWSCRKIDLSQTQDKYEIVDYKHILVHDRNKIFQIRDEEDEIIDVENMRYFYQVEDLKDN